MNQSRFRDKLSILSNACDTSFEGTVYRFIQPRYYVSTDIVQGMGGLRASGRWNTKGEFRVVYTCLDTETADEEVLAHARYFNLPISHALPRVLVAISAQLSCVLDLTKGNVRKRLQLPETMMREQDWRRENQRGRECLTQAWGKTFSNAGYEAILVPSAVSGGKNLVVFPENLRPKARFKVKTEVEWG